MGDRLERLELTNQLEQDIGFADVHWLAEVDSTNDYAKRWMALAPESQLPFLIVADKQTAGRGRGSNSWWSPSGCLMFSVVWTPKILQKTLPKQTHESVEAAYPAIIERLPQIALVTGIALCKALDSFIGITTRIKWPNDIYLSQKKVAGILVESAGNAWVIGIGINVETLMDDAPLEVQQRATSLHYWSNRKPNIDEVLLACCTQLAQEMDAWSHDETYLLQHWPSRCLLTDQLCEVTIGCESWVGLCQGIDPYGCLRLIDAKGKEQRILSGTVRLVNETDAR